MIPLFRFLDEKNQALIVSAVIDEAIKLAKTYSSDIHYRTCWASGYIRAMIPEMTDISDVIVARLTLEEMGNATVDKD